MVTSLIVDNDCICNKSVMGCDSLRQLYTQLLVCNNLVMVDLPWSQVAMVVVVISLPMTIATMPLRWHLLVTASVNWMLKTNGCLGESVGTTMRSGDLRGSLGGTCAYLHVGMATVRCRLTK